MNMASRGEVIRIETGIISDIITINGLNESLR